MKTNNVSARSIVKWLKTVKENYRYTDPSITAGRKSLQQLNKIHNLKFYYKNRQSYGFSFEYNLSPIKEIEFGLYRFIFDLPFAISHNRIKCVPLKNYINVGRSYHPHIYIPTFYSVTDPCVCLGFTYGGILKQQIEKFDFYSAVEIMKTCLDNATLLDGHGKTILKGVKGISFCESCDDEIPVGEYFCEHCR